MRRRSNEPFWWVPFAGGMMIDALAMPALIIITGFLGATGMISAQSAQPLLQHPATRAVLFVIISMTFFHAAHRLRFALPDLGMRGAAGALPFICYGGASVGTILTGLVALGVI